MSYCERCGKDYGGSTHLCPPGSAQAVGVPLVTAFTCSPCPYCAELKAENARLETELSNSIHEHGQSSGFWGRAAAREVDMRRKAEQRLVARIAERDA